MIRADGRSCGESRPVEITTGFIKFAEGSALIRCGDTVVLCNASVEDRVPPHVRPGCGWVTAEYSMLPRANRERSRRDVDKLKLSGRSAEIQRLIGRSLRAAVDMRRLGERTITVDCDVLQGDGGTRTASVTGGFVALALACRGLLEQGLVKAMPIGPAVQGDGGADGHRADEAGRHRQGRHRHRHCPGAAGAGEVRGPGRGDRRPGPL